MLNGFYLYCSLRKTTRPSIDWRIDGLITLPRIPTDNLNDNDLNRKLPHTAFSDGDDGAILITQIIVMQCNLFY